MLLIIAEDRFENKRAIFKILISHVMIYNYWSSSMPKATCLVCSEVEKQDVGGWRTCSMFEFHAADWI